jgi:hypothetical protein
MKKPQATRTRTALPLLTADVLEPERPLTNAERLAAYYRKRDQLEASTNALRVEVCR